MLRSMTGYGRGEAEGAYHRITVEMRSVNSRHLDVNLKLPPGCWYLEPAIRKEIQARLARGRVDVFVKWEPKTLDVEPLVEIHLGRARAIKNALDTLGREMGVEGKRGWELLLGLRELWELREPALEQEQEALMRALDMALNGLEEMRESEGRILAQDLRARAQWIQGRIWELKRRSPQILSSFIAKWKERVRLLAEEGNLEESRIEQEAAIWAEKLDVTEELVRLEAHLERFLKTMEEQTPVGKKMEFLLQELFREINTLAAKSQDLEMSDVAVSIKAELERMREQVQNLE
jgi:uncharacterized protein (TIGR00255 family)